MTENFRSPSESQEEELKRTGAYQRLVNNLTREILWIYILSLLRERPLYGYEIRKEIQRRFGFKPGQVTSYRVLYSLKRDGYIVMKTQENSDRGPARKYYEITGKGEELIGKAAEFLRELQGKLFRV